MLAENGALTIRQITFPGHDWQFLHFAGMAIVVAGIGSYAGGAVDQCQRRRLYALMGSETASDDDMCLPFCHTG